MQIRACRTHSRKKQIIEKKIPPVEQEVEQEIEY